MQLPSEWFCTVASHLLQFFRNKRKGSREATVTRKRQRKTVRDVFYQLGRTYFRRAYRMEWEIFLNLYDLIEEDH